MRAWSSWFRTGLQVIYRHASKTLALICIIAFFVVVADYFSEPEAGDIYKGHWAGCGNFKALKHGAASFDQDILVLKIRDVQPAKFLISGELSVSRATYLKHFRDAKRILVELDRLSSSSFLLPMPSSWIEVELPQVREIDNRRQVSLRLKNYELHVDGSLQRFPFDDYRLGFTPSVHVLRPEAESSRPYPVEVTIVNVNMSNAFVVQKAQTTAQFKRDYEPSDPSLNERYGVDQCALVFKRPIWYQAMIVFLVALLLAPAAYIFYKPDVDPGVELVAAILGVAAIRAFFLGGLAEWNLYPIDIVLAFCVLVTAVIPLLRLPRKRTRKL